MNPFVIAAIVAGFAALIYDEKKKSASLQPSRPDTESDPKISDEDIDAVVLSYSEENRPEIKPETRDIIFKIFCAIKKVGVSSMADLDKVTDELKSQGISAQIETAHIAEEILSEVLKRQQRQNPRLD